jgi:hypothetical protein
MGFNSGFKGLSVTEVYFQAVLCRMLEGKVSPLVIKYRVMRLSWVGVDMATAFGTGQLAMRVKAGHITSVPRSLPEIVFFFASHK